MSRTACVSPHLDSMEGTLLEKMDSSHLPKRGSEMPLSDMTFPEALSVNEYAAGAS